MFIRHRQPWTNTQLKINTLLVAICRCSIMGTNMIPLNAFLVVLKATGDNEIDADETACIIANLIYQVSTIRKLQLFTLA